MGPIEDHKTIAAICFVNNKKLKNHTKPPQKKQKKTEKKFQKRKKKEYGLVFAYAMGLMESIAVSVKFFCFEHNCVSCVLIHIELVFQRFQTFFFLLLNSEDYSVN